MSGTSNSTDSQGISTIPKNDSPKVTDVYIGVFFDGTNNNMLWAKKKHKNYLNKYKKQSADSGQQSKVKDGQNTNPKNPFDQFATAESIKKEHSKFENCQDVKDFIHFHVGFEDESKLKKQPGMIEENEPVKQAVRDYTKGNSEDCGAVKKAIRDYIKGNSEDNSLCGENCNDSQFKFCKLKRLLEEKFKDDIRIFRNSHTRHEPSKCGSYSNIAILYSIFSPKPKKSNAKTYHIYIEGSGATDISHIFNQNINGLGFGLGNTGVVALVSKAVFYVTNYINSIKGELNNKANIHFQIYGFSRGATCARLFAYLIARGKDEKLGKREKEFEDFYAKGLFDEKTNRIPFLEDDRYNKTVDFLGIYDTVVSIGFLRQKDGYVNPKQVPYGFAPNYNENWHYNNVNEYGMFSTSSAFNNAHENKIKSICHICAMDEYRENFALTDVGATVGSNAIEVFIPGCHSDVGGGYYEADEEQEILLRKYTKRSKSDNQGEISKLINSIHKLGDKAKDRIDKLGDEAIQQIKKVQRETVDLEGAIIQIVKITGEKTANVVRDLIEKLNNIEQENQTNDIVGEINSTLSKIKGIIEDIESSIQGQIEPLFNKLTKKTKELSDKITLKTSEVFEYVKSTFPKTRCGKKENVKTWVRDFPYDDYNKSNNTPMEQSPSSDAQGTPSTSLKPYICRKTLSDIGWIDNNWDKPARATVTLFGKEVPCTIRVVENDKMIQFKRNVQAGYSNIPLRMMIEYALKSLKSLKSEAGEYKSLFGEPEVDKTKNGEPEEDKTKSFPLIDVEYKVPADLSIMAEEMLAQMNSVETGKRVWLHPGREDYRKLRMRYLHFTSTETGWGNKALLPLGHWNNPFDRRVKPFEYSGGNIANTPNYDLDGRLCRITYHGDHKQINYSDIEYMYNYDGENVNIVFFQKQ